MIELSFHIQYGLKMAEKRYIWLANLFLDRINEGRWKVGDVFPSEVDLAGEFQVSRSTVRLALSRLEGWGMVTRKRKRGTILTSLAPKQVFQRQIGSLGQLDEFAQQTKLHIVEFYDTDGQTLTQKHNLNPALNGRWVEYTGWRSWVGDEVPVSWTKFAFSSLYEGAKDLMGKSQKPSFKVIEDAFRLRVTAIDQHIRATSIDSEVAQFLNLEAGSAALEVKRLMFDEADKPIIHAHSIHRADAVSMRMRMELAPKL